MKKSFSYNLTQFGSADNTVTEQIKTSDGVKTITTDANTGAVILADSVDEDSLNPVTGAAVATAIAQGGGSSYTAGDGIDIQNDEISVKVDGTTIQVNASGELEAIGSGSSSVVVDSSSPLSGEGTEASPLGLSIDTNTLEVSSGGLDLSYTETFASDSDTALYLDSAGPVTITVSGLTASASNRNVWVAISWDLGSHYITWTDPMIVAANSTTATFTLDVHDIDTAASMGSWSTAAGRNYYFYFTADDGQWSEETYSEVTAGSGAHTLSVKNPVPSASSDDNGKVLGVTDSSGTIGWVSAGGGGGSSASGYFVPFYNSSLEMIDTSVINGYGTYIEGGVGSRLTQYWYPGAMSQISINLPASVAGAANDTYKATLSIQLVDGNDASNTIWLVRNTENTGVGVGDIPPNYSYGNLSFNFTIGPRDFPYNYSIKEMTFRIEDSTNSSQTMNIPGWYDLNTDQREIWSRNTAGIMLTQVPVSITPV